MTASRTDEIARRLREARAAYYDTDRPVMTDAEFDALEDHLRSLDPGHEFFATVGHPAGEAAPGGKIRHRIAMLSMGKAKGLGEAEKWLRRLGPDPGWSLSVQPKIDGLSASLGYENGRLTFAATRGDGETGQVITRIAPYVADIPDRINFTRKPVEIRGELHLPKNTEYDTGGRPLRNNCVGLINRKGNRENLRFVRFVAYQVVWPGSPGQAGGGTAALPEDARGEPRLASESGKIDILAEAGFYTFRKWVLRPDCEAEPGSAEPGSAEPGSAEPGSAEPGSAEPGSAEPGAPEPDAAGSLAAKLGEAYEEYIGSLRDKWNYETDGLVVVVDDNRLHDAIDRRWVVDHHHHYALALKPPSQAARTPLRGIAWQVSRQGNLTPVAGFEPVSMGGATLERASLHNADNVRRLRLAAGDAILVERANDVIPYVRDNPAGRERPEGFRDERLWPRQCPSCGSLPVERGVNLACPNAECRDRVLQGVLYWVRQADIEQVALKTLESLYDAGKLKSIQDLYTLTEDDFKDLEGFGEKKIRNFLDQVARAKSMGSAEFIARLGIPMVQRKSLARLGILTMEDFRNFDDESYVTGQRIVEWKSDPGNMELVDGLLANIVLEDPRPAIRRKGVVCLTGSAPVPRKALIAALEKAGWTVAGTVTKETAAVVCDDAAGSSSKLKKAREAGIRIVTYQEFLRGEGIAV